MTDDAIIEANINYVSYKRTICYKGDYIGHEISANVNEEVGFEKTEKWIRNKTNYLLQESMKRIDSRFDEVTKYKGDK